MELAENHTFWYLPSILVFIMFFIHSLSCAGLLFSTRLKKAVIMQAKHGQAFAKFNITFPPAAVDKWEKMVLAWDKDKTKKNPYEEPVAGKRQCTTSIITA